MNKFSITPVKRPLAPPAATHLLTTEPQLSRDEHIYEDKEHDDGQLADPADDPRSRHNSFN